MGFRVAIDTGGTFTDAIAVDDKGNLITAKVPTTPEDLKVGTINAIDALARLNKLERKQFLSRVVTLVHGTTVGTNTIITRTGPKTGIITTVGHQDILQLRRVPKDDVYDWRKPQPEPLVPRHLRVEVEERIGSKGEILIPLNEDAVRKAVAYLKKLKVESIVVALLWSFVYPEHERRVAEIIKEEYPEAQVTLSHEILPSIGEHERTSTTVISAYIAPAMTRYIKTMTEFLEKEDFKGQFLFIQNNGGVETAEVGLENPATMAMSGPAAGPSAALAVGKLLGEENLLSVDMGGTSFDIAIIEKGSFMTRTENLIAEQRFSLPIIDINSIGAGGGSIAWFDSARTLHVGPKSVGANPGPACYGAGGEEASVTDAYVVLGYISPDYFLGGEIKLRKDLSEKVIKEKVADPLGISILKAAYAIHKIINSVMANGVITTFTRRGYDPRDFVFVAGGAATPVCALKMAQELSISRVLIPKYAPIYCAFGMLGVDLRHDFKRFYLARDETLSLEHLKKLYGEMEEQGLALLGKEGVPEKDRVLERSMHVRYFGQFRELEVQWPSGPINDAAIAEGLVNFHRKHNELFGYSDEKYPVQFMGFGLAVIGRMPALVLKNLDRGGTDPVKALKGERDAYFEESDGFIKTKVYDGDKLLGGNVLEGPCIVEERMTNVIIPPTFTMYVDEYGNYFSK